MLDAEINLQRFTRSYFAALIGLQAMFLCFITVGRAPYSHSQLNALTAHGAELFRPEHELSIYLLGIVATILASLLFERCFPINRQAPVEVMQSIVKCLIATSATAGFVGLTALLAAQSGLQDR